MTLFSLPNANLTDVAGDFCFAVVLCLNSLIARFFLLFIFYYLLYSANSFLITCFKGDVDM